MAVARSRGSVPKDLGLDLLILKEKRRVSDPYDRRIEEEARVVRVEGPTEFRPDPRGSFRIFVDEPEIVAVLYTPRGTPIVVVRGKTAEEVSNEIARRELVSDFEHAAYLGRELEKAEIALRTGRGYVQEMPLF
jgi:dihydropteroate synthase-like protein